jgi:hypothetical protein
LSDYPSQISGVPLPDNCFSSAFTHQRKSRGRIAPRATFASCWLAVRSDVNRLTNLIGHTSPKMLWRHYHKAVTQKQVKAFWKIEPLTKSKSKMIRLAT